YLRAPRKVCSRRKYPRQDRALRRSALGGSEAGNRRAFSEGVGDCILSFIRRHGKQAAPAFDARRRDAGNGQTLIRQRAVGGGFRQTLSVINHDTASIDSAVPEAIGQITLLDIPGPRGSRDAFGRVRTSQ